MQHALSITQPQVQTLHIRKSEAMIKIVLFVSILSCLVLAVNL